MFGLLRISKTKRGELVRKKGDTKLLGQLHLSFSAKGGSRRIYKDSHVKQTIRMGVNSAPEEGEGKGKKG